MGKNESKLERFERKLFETCVKYAEIDAKSNIMTLKVSFFGLLLHPNIPSILNFDILYLYKAFQRRHIEVRIHDPHISPTDAKSYGIHIGRQSKSEKWTHSHDVLILSTPHNFYLKNRDKLVHMFKTHKTGLWLDLFGYLSPIALADLSHVSVIDFCDESLDAELMGSVPPRPLLDWNPVDDS